jgi:hypothetical protein
MLQMADSRRRFVMPKEASIGPNDPAEVEVLPDGRVLISPVLVIPLHETWALTAESTGQTEAAFRDYRAGRTIDTAALDGKISARIGKRGGT